jgi:hypothetical protein
MQRAIVLILSKRFHRRVNSESEDGISEGMRKKRKGIGGEGVFWQYSCGISPISTRSGVLQN